MRNWPDKHIKFTQVHGLNYRLFEGKIVVEVPVALSVNGKIWVTLICTPVDIDALAVGFLYNENIIDSMKDVKNIEISPVSRLVEVWLNKEVEKPSGWRITSGCTGGVTAVVDKLKYNADCQVDGYQISSSEVISLSKELIEYQGLHQQVGGTHASALSDGEDLILVCEDIGRHNTIDKVIGKILIHSIDIKRKILLTTGRVSSEMLQKTARFGALMIISLTSPTSLSIEMAQEIGITLIGYARGKKFNIYSHPERILITTNEKPIKT
ncbi:MAG: formate dehydrogenase accessory sulfurtransferase FdhD [Anaerolineales bacterium]